MSNLVIQIITLLLPAISRLIEALAVSIGPAANDISFGEQVYDIIRTQDMQPKTAADKHADAMAEIQAVYVERGNPPLRRAALNALVTLAVLRLRQEQDA